MRWILNLIFTLAWALWFGGLITLFISVSVMFKSDRAVAMQAAPMLFHAFERYQLVLAAVGIVSGMGVWMLHRNKRGMAAVVLLILCGLVGLVQMNHISRRMDELRVAGQSSGEEFKSLHGKSMTHYVGEAAMLLVIGLLIVPGTGTGRRIANQANATV